jgi:hypothetical protein
MTTPILPTVDRDEAMPEWHEPFPEPQTIPSGWNLSAILVSLSSKHAQLNETVGDD